MLNAVSCQYLSERVIEIIQFIEIFVFFNFLRFQWSGESGVGVGVLISGLSIEKI